MENVRAAPLERRRRWFFAIKRRESGGRASERANGLSLSTVIVVGFSAARRRRWRCHDNLPGGHYFDGIGGRH